MTYSMSDIKRPDSVSAEAGSTNLESRSGDSSLVTDAAFSNLAPGAPPVLQLETPTAAVDLVATDSMTDTAAVPRWLNKSQPGRRPEDRSALSISTVVPLPQRPEATEAPDTAGHSTSLTKIPEGWTLRGNMVAKNPVSIAGHLEGNVEITSGAVLTLERPGIVNGTLSAAGGITVAGRFKGHIDAPRGSVRITDTAFVDGKVTYNRISMEGGQHRLEMVYVDAAGSTD